MLNEDCKDMLQVLSENQVKFLLVGAYALGAHGYPRATGDIDIWVQPSLDNSMRVYHSLAAFGARVQRIDETTFAQKGIVFQIGVVPRRIDITEATGLEFEHAYQNRETIDAEGLAIPVLSRSDLIKNKRATCRDKDRLDADKLEGRSS